MKTAPEKIGFKEALAEVLVMAGVSLVMLGEEVTEQQKESLSLLKYVADADILMATLPSTDSMAIEVARARLWPSSENELAAELARAKQKLERGRAILYLDRDNDPVWNMLGNLFHDDNPNDEPAAQLAKKFEVVEHVRREVLDFAKLMEDQLRRHDDRPGWKDAIPDLLLADLADAFLSLRNAVENGEPTAAVARRAANLSNFAMILTDLHGGLSKP